jgi:hypothetical protein
MNNLLIFAYNRPLTFLVGWVVLGWVVMTPFRYFFLAYNRRLRSLNVRVQGWTVPPLDADGDVVYKEEKTPSPLEAFSRSRR